MNNNKKPTIAQVKKVLAQAPKSTVVKVVPKKTMQEICGKYCAGQKATAGK